MKSIIFVPFTDYFRSRKRVVTKFIAPFIVAGVALLASLVFNIGDAETVFSTFHSFIDMQIKYCSNFDLFFGCNYNDYCFCR